MNGRKWGRLLALAAALVLLFTCASAEDALRGYSKEDGYVYLRLGRYPQTADGGVEPILWRVLTPQISKKHKIL